MKKCLTESDFVRHNRDHADRLQTKNVPTLASLWLENWRVPFLAVSGGPLPFHFLPIPDVISIAPPLPRPLSGPLPSF
jgi:hypothetical protein